jgi:arylsulfatase A-like enzyme
MDPAHPGRGYARSQMENPDPEKFQEAFVRAYTSEIEHLDRELGRLFDGLKARGVYDDSVIVFTSDHGEEFHEHGGWWHGQTLFDEVIEVPLLIKLPQNQLAGAVNEYMTRHLDIAPTLVALAGMTPGEQFQGQALFQQDWQPGNALVGSSYAELDFEAIVMDALRTPTLKLVHSNENKRNHPPVALFDMHQDPGEQTNVYGDPALTVEQGMLEMNRDEMQQFLEGHAADPSLVEDTSLMQEQMDNIGYGGGGDEEVEE